MRACSVATVLSDSARPPWTLAHQAPLSVRFSRQKYWSGIFPPPEVEPVSLLSPELADGLSTTSATWEAHVCAQMHWVSWQALSLTDSRLGAGGAGG